MRKKVAFLVFLIGGVYLIVVLARDLQKMLLAKNRIIEAEERVETLNEEKEKLERELAEATSEAFVEKEARDKLMLAKEGEVVVLLPEVPEVQEVRKVEEAEERLENWEKWIRLFVY